MRMHWVIQAGVGMVTLTALVACGSSTTTTGGGGSGAGTTATTGNGGGGGTGGGAGGNPNGKTCNDVYTGAWDTTLTESDFMNAAAFAAYDALNTCACVDKMAAGGCDDLCKMGDNTTTTPNFCDGVAALTQCGGCLNSTSTPGCGTQVDDCTSN